jgi:TolB-like protein
LIILSPGKHCEQFAEGLEREIIDSLVNRNGWTIVTRTAGHPAEAEVGVGRLMLLGTIRNAKKNYRLSMQLLSEPDGTVLWSHMFDFEEEGVISTQEKIAQSVCDQLKQHLSGSEAD